MARVNPCPDATRRWRSRPYGAPWLGAVCWLGALSGCLGSGPAPSATSAAGNAGSGGAAGTVSARGSAGGTAGSGTRGAGGVAGSGGTPGVGDASAGSGGTATDGGDASAGTGGIAGSGGTAGNQDAGADADAAPPVSQYCGDGVRDPVTEECDDKTGTDPPDSCTAQCQVQDLVAGPAMPLSEAGAVMGGRRLGTGRHPVAGGPDGFAVAKVREEQGSVLLVLSTFDRDGVPLEKSIDVGKGTTPILDANPVVAALGGGKYGVAWTDFGGDGDELGIAMRTVDGTTGAVGPLRVANTATAFSQYDPDILRVGSTVVVSWMDDADAINGPDLELRTFDTSLSPQGGQTVLANDPAGEGDVALAPFEGSWAVAWRSAENGLETLHAKVGGMKWTVGPILGGPADDKPALAELDATHLLLVFTEGTDPGNTGIYDVPRLRDAILATDSPGPTGKFDIVPQVAVYSDPTVGLSHPNAVRAGDHVYISWRSSAQMNDLKAEELWLSRVDPTPVDGGVIASFQQEIPLPRWSSHQLGDQRRPALSPSLLPWGSGTALATAWEEYGGNFGVGEGNPDVVVELIPTPIVRSGIALDAGSGQ